MMRPELCSVHTHSTMCDGKDTLEDMAKAAYERGVRYFGASGHSHTPNPADEGNVLPADVTEYRSKLLQLREQYQGEMELLLGLEWDSVSDVDWSGFDYWIGSVHNLYNPEEGRYYCMDWEREDLIACRDRYCGGDVYRMIERYFHDVAMVAEKSPTILGHIDLITKLNGDGSLFDEENPRYQRAALETLHAVDPSKTLLEINTGAIARGYRTMPYPADYILKEWKQMGGQVILTSDAHRADAIVYGYDLAAECAKRAGFRESILLTKDGWKPCAL